MHTPTQIEVGVSSASPLQLLESLCQHGGLCSITDKKHNKQTKQKKNPLLSVGHSGAFIIISSLTTSPSTHWAYCPTTPRDASSAPSQSPPLS